MTQEQSVQKLDFYPHSDGKIYAEQLEYSPANQKEKPKH